MPKYLCLQRSASGPCEPPKPEEMQRMMERFREWSQKFQREIVDMGGRLGAGGHVVSATGVTDGPFAETKEMLGGFMIVEADSIELALQVVRESPGVMGPGSSVEVREIQTS